MRLKTIELYKPLFKNKRGYFHNIYDKHLKDAIKEKKIIQAKTFHGIYEIDPKQWIATGKKMEQVFKRPDEPMILYGNYLKPPTPEEKEQEIYRKYLI